MRLLAVAPLALLALLAPCLAGTAHAACPGSAGDLSPGVLDASTTPPTWTITGDGRIDVADAVVALRQVVGLHRARWAAPGPSCERTPGDVAPGTRVGATTPPLWLPVGDGAIDVGDVIVILRLTVGLEAIDDGLTYWRDAKVVLDEKCGGCHVAGGVGPFATTTYPEVLDAAAAMAHEIEDGHMPPWPPSPECNDYQHSRALSEAQRAMLLAWIAAGAPEGDPATEPPPVDPPPPITYDVVLPMPEPYQPDGSVSDDYRCFVMDWPLSTQVHATALRVTPDRDELVHHVIAYAVAPSGVAEARAKDAAEAGPGYTCFGGPGTSLAASRWVGAWVPGAQGGAFPAGTGIRIAPGSVIVMQVHYNMDSAAPVPDRSVLELRTAPTVARPAAVMLFADFTFDIPAGDPDFSTSVASAARDVVLPFRSEIGGGLNDPIVLHGAGLHMHQLGTSTDLTVLRPGGVEDCVLDIPDWDFHWQGDYGLVQPMTVAMTDQIRLRCAWDNSAENQAWVGGEQQPPQDVQWGEGSRDEMCLAVMYATAP